MTICIAIIPAITVPLALRGDRGAAPIAILGVAALLFAYFWLSRFRLTITPHSLTYTSLFTGERVIQFSELTESDIVWESYPPGRAYSRPLLQLVVGGKATRINFKVFSLEAAQALFHLVGPNQSLQPTAGRSDE
jgi:hypothetical protein